MIDENNLAAAIGLPDEPPVTNKQRMDFNAYIQWMQKRGMAGKPELDKNNLGKNLFAKYIKENPSTSLTMESVIPIQNELAKYRQWSIEQLRNKKAQLVDAKNPNGRWVEPNEDLSNYMHELSIVDGYPGSRTSSHSFPLEYMKTFEDGNLIKTENRGLINTTNPVIPK